MSDNYGFISYPLDNGVVSAMRAAQAFEDFVISHTGDVDNDGKGLFFVNNQGIVNNNLHTLNRETVGIGSDNGSTTEAQSLTILGYLGMYEATKNPYWLQRAEWFTDAYLTYYYFRRPIPNPPEKYRSNNNVNARAPFLTGGPVNWANPSRVGVMGLALTVTNSLAHIPHGHPHYGDKLLLATMAYSGELVWQSIVARVDEGDPDAPGKKYGIEWFINYDGRKVNEDRRNVGDGSNPDNFPKGTVKLKESVAGPVVLKFAYATTAGLLVDRNEPFEKYPIWHGVRPGENGTAIDSETWLQDALWQLWIYTKKPHYRTWFECSTLVIEEASDIDSDDQYFRRDSRVATPFTEGISYWWIWNAQGWVKNVDVMVSRDANGFITVPLVNPPSSTQIAFEQQAVWNAVMDNATLSVDYQTTNPNSDVRIELHTTDSVAAANLETVNQWIWLDSNPETFLHTETIQAQDMILFKGADNQIYAPAAMLAHTQYGPVSSAKLMRNETTLIHGATNEFWGRKPVIHGRSDETLTGGIIVGFWGLEGERTRMVGSLAYRTGSSALGVYAQIKIRDDINQPAVTWRANLAPTAGGLTGKFIHTSLSFVAYNYNTGALLSPQPAWGVVSIKQAEIVFPGSGSAPREIEILYWGTKPSTMKQFITNHKTNVVHFKFLVASESENTIKLGDAKLISTTPSRLSYTPGAIPFSNNFSDDANRMLGYRGIPYMGYQYPLVYIRHGSKYGVHLKNIVKFLRDSQTDYAARRGLLGPVPGAFIWSRWDNVKSGAPETFIDATLDFDATDESADFGTRTFWAGYYNRAMWAMCVTWQRLVEDGMYNDPMVDAETRGWIKDYCEDWVRYLRAFQLAYNGTVPTEYPDNELPHSKNSAGVNGMDFSVAITSHYLAGACAMYLAGSRIPELEPFIEAAFSQLISAQESRGLNHHMNGSWSDYAGGNYFYGFHCEVLRALGYYIMYRNRKLIST